MHPHRRHPQIDDHIRLNTDVPELSLHRGDIGVVRSTWFDPGTVFEVEFDRFGQIAVRVLLLADQVDLDERT